jgi:L-fuculose-phosphate aldolase
VGYAPYAMMTSDQLAVNVSEAFARGFNSVLFENHSAAAGGGDLLEAFERLETLDFCARTLIHARGLCARGLRAQGPGAAGGSCRAMGTGQSTVCALSDAQLSLANRPPDPLAEFTPTVHSSRERELRQQMVEIVHRAYDRCLMTSVGGVMSARVAHSDVGRFLITPEGMDRRAIEIEDLVLVDKGRREMGKWPDRSVGLHQAIYDRHPEIGCVVTAPAPYITAYALVADPFDTKTIPECYVMLRHVDKVPFDLYYRAPEQVAERLSRRTPVLVVENEGVLTTGRTVLQAFDRLEVAEYSAQSLIDIASKLGEWMPLGKQDLRDLEEAFGLE